jgi:hypothetical protein
MFLQLHEQPAFGTRGWLRPSLEGQAPGLALIAAASGTRVAGAPVKHSLTAKFAISILLSMLHPKSTTMIESFSLGYPRLPTPESISGSTVVIQVVLQQ